MYSINLHILIFTCSISALSAQLYLPANACPEYFQYESDGFTYFGKITLPQLPVGRAEVIARFSQRGMSTSNFYGSITPYPDKSTVVRNVLNRQPVTFRVEFANAGIPPKLTLLSLNGFELCVSSNYPLPMTWFQLYYRLCTYNSGDNSLPTSNLPISLASADLDGRLNFPTIPQFQPNQSVNQHSLGQSMTTDNLFPAPGMLNSKSNNTQRPIAAQATPPSTSPPNTALTTLNLESICGREGTVIRGFVYGGVEVARGQFPWLTAVYKKDTDALSFKCGGSLVSRRTVISAAHCFRRLTAEQIVLFFGRHDLESYSEDGIVTRDVNKLILHPEYENDKPNADIALLQIEALDQFTQYIQPICLWSESLESSLIVGKTATVVGWGYEGKENGDISALPNMVDVTVTSKDDCVSSSAAFQQLITENTICAGNRDGTGPCMGDSGSGLMLQRNGRWVLRGTVSVGQSKQKRCNLFEYVLYCDVARHMSWLRRHFLD